MVNLKKLIITGAITLGVLGICRYSAYAVTTPQNNSTSIQTQQQYCNLVHSNCNLNHNNNHNNGYNGQHHNNGNGHHNTW